MFPAVSYIFFIRPALLDQREEVGFTKCWSKEVGTVMLELKLM
jgi:hypothetical protein